MQAPFAFDSDGNLVISAKMVEALGLVKDQSAKEWGLFVKDGRLHARLLDVESLTFGKLQDRDDMTKADPSEVIRAISGEIKQGDLHPGLSEAIDGITAEQQARADEDSALASRASSLESRIDVTDAELAAEQQARSDGDSALASDIRALSQSNSDEIARLDSRIDGLAAQIDRLAQESSQTKHGLWVAETHFRQVIDELKREVKECRARPDAEPEDAEGNLSKWNFGKLRK